MAFNYSQLHYRRVIPFAMSNEIRVVIVEPKKPAYEKTIPHDLTVFQELVGGYIEVVPLQEGYLLVCNEEGKLINLPPNRPLSLDTIHGTFFVVGYDGEEDFSSLTDEQVDELLQLWGEPSFGFSL